MTGICGARRRWSSSTSSTLHCLAASSPPRGAPTPGLPSPRVLYGGPTTSNMAAAGVGAISGTSFTVSSGVHANRTITVLSANPVTAPTLAAELRNRLLEADPRYTTSVVTRPDTTQGVLIHAPLPFT